ncbi:MAG TPA: flagellar protein FlaG [Herbaspirillum sp.]|jgi:flagellar protein FlaG
MSISPVDSSVAQDPSPVVGKAVAVKDPIVSSGPVTSSDQSDRPVSQGDLTQAVGKLNDSWLSKAGLSFEQDKTSKLMVVSVIGQDGTVVRQLPSKAALALAESIDETLSRGSLVNQKA